MTILQRKNCWTCCDACRVKWSKLEPPTQYAHMTIRQVQGQTVTRFVCDNCLESVKANNVIE
jgi:hypothetical protein